MPGFVQTDSALPTVFEATNIGTLIYQLPVPAYGDLIFGEALFGEILPSLDLGAHFLAIDDISATQFVEQ
jgi:hypothetical protein